jgi:peptidoglycan hydrolase FlgJ
VRSDWYPGSSIVAISPPSDIVLDVARAADPERYRAAVERLTRLRAAAVAQSSPSQTAEPPAVRSPASLPLDAGARTQPRRRLDAYGQFESFVLQSFLQSMLPRNAVSVFGRGSAGEFWRSMLAEKMGDELARSGQVGIAARLSAGPGHPAQPGAAIDPVASPPSLASTIRNARLPTPSAPQALDEPAPGVQAPDGGS